MRFNCISKLITIAKHSDIPVFLSINTFLAVIWRSADARRKLSNQRPYPDQPSSRGDYRSTPIQNSWAEGFVSGEGVLRSGAEYLVSSSPERRWHNSDRNLVSLSKTGSGLNQHISYTIPSRVFPFKSRFIHVEPCSVIYSIVQQRLATDGNVQVFWVIHSYVQLCSAMFSRVQTFRETLSHILSCSAIFSECSVMLDRPYSGMFNNLEQSSEVVRRYSVVFSNIHLFSAPLPWTLVERCYTVPGNCFRFTF